MQHIDNGVYDKIEHYNSEYNRSSGPIRFNSSSVNRDTTKRTHPEAIRPFIPEIKEFGKFNHFNVLHPIMR